MAADEESGNVQLAPTVAQIEKLTLGQLMQQSQDQLPANTIAAPPTNGLAQDSMYERKEDGDEEHKQAAAFSSITPTGPPAADDAEHKRYEL